MPTYEYECTACDHSFEVFQSMSEAPLTACPVCGKRIRRVIGGGMGVIFRGSGFYVNDSRKKGCPAENPSGSGKPAADKPAACAGCPAAKEAV